MGISPGFVKMPMDGGASQTPVQQENIRFSRFGISYVKGI